MLPLITSECIFKKTTTNLRYKPDAILTLSKITALSSNAQSVSPSPTGHHLPGYGRWCPVGEGLTLCAPPLRGELTGFWGGGGSLPASVPSFSFAIAGGKVSRQENNKDPGYLVGGGSCGGNLGEPLASWGGGGGTGFPEGLRGHGLAAGISAGAPMQGSSCQGLGCPNPVGPWAWKPLPLRSPLHSGHTDRTAQGPASAKT